MRLLWFLYYFLVLILVAWHEWPSSPPSKPPSPIVIVVQEADLDERIQDLEERLYWYQKSQCGSRSEKAEAER